MEHLSQLSRKSMIDALVNEEPDKARIWFEVLSDEELYLEFFNHANAHSERIKEQQSIQVGNR
ncbi:hypothetical protein [Lactiplantibacillus paraxiangfangensis]|uniref:hypothetical protein n=1 Tax=Lactiplantibacillus paraxiangfangensis TaxID=3076224 RepID=UPI0030C6F765